MYELQLQQRQVEEQQAEQDAPPTPPTNSETGNAPGNDTPPSVIEKSGDKLFTQADLERQIDMRLKRERDKHESQAQKAALEAEERRKTEQGEWQTLAEQRKTQLEQLMPKSELADRLSELFTKQLDAEIATWPEEAQPLVLPPDSPLLQRIDSADRARPIAQKLMAALGNGGNGTPNTPTPGLRFPAQHPGGNAAPITTKTVAENTLRNAYAPRKPAS